MCSVRTNYDKVGALINNGFEAAKRYGARQAGGRAVGWTGWSGKKLEPKIQNTETRDQTRDQDRSQLMRIL